MDSLSDKAFTLEQKENYIKILKSYAAIFYNILSKYQFSLRRVTESIKTPNNTSAQQIKNMNNTRKERRNKRH